MTTPCELQLFHNNKQFCNDVAKKVLKEAKRLELKYNYFDKNSYLSKINARVANVLDLETKELLKKSKRYYISTDYIFDITLATIKDIYLSNNIKKFSQEKDRLLKYVGCENFEIKKNKIYFSNVFTKIDFGGVVKEYAVDKVVKIIKKHKIKSALINFGGDIFAIGKKENGDKFKIGIKNPFEKKQNLTYVEIMDEALTTSASYERSYVIQDNNFSHIISKENTKSNILSATVVSNSCLNSGVYSTSLMINDLLDVPYKRILVHKDLSITN